MWFTRAQAISQVLTYGVAVCHMKEWKTAKLGATIQVSTIVPIGYETSLVDNSAGLFLSHSPAFNWYWS